MSLWICLYLPTLSLDTAFPGWSAASPAAAVLRKGLIETCTPAAQALGVRTGMRPRTALGLVPGLDLRHTDATANRRTLETLALKLLRYTPDLSIVDECSITLDIQRSLDLFGGPRRLWKDIAGIVASHAPAAMQSLAPSARGAWLLAHQAVHRRRRALRVATLARLLDPLPVSLLPEAYPHATWLQGLGCAALSQLRQLPRAGLRRRSSTELMQALDSSYGTIDEFPPRYTPALSFRQRYELIERLEHVEGVLAAAEHAIRQLCLWLDAGQLATLSLELRLHHETGRHARPPTCIGLGLSAASWLPDDFQAVLTETLRRQTLEAPVVAIEIAVSKAMPRPAANHTLLPDPARQDAQENRLLNLLQARLGSLHVLRPTPQDSHLPELANRWAGIFTAESGTAPPSSAALQAVAARPFWLLPRPEPLQTLQDRPVRHHRPLRLVQGPERIETGWWAPSGHQRRDYFIAEDPSGARYWVYRQRDTPSPQWFLQGLFG